MILFLRHTKFKPNYEYIASCISQNLQYKFYLLNVFAFFKLKVIIIKDNQ